MKRPQPFVFTDRVIEALIEWFRAHKRSTRTFLIVEFLFNVYCVSHLVEFTAWASGFIRALLSLVKMLSGLVGG